MDKELKKQIKDLGFISSVGMSMAFSIAVGALAGFYLDKYFDTKPWLFLFLGIRYCRCIQESLYPLQ